MALRPCNVIPIGKPKQAFPSRRQARCKGLDRSTYPSYLRDQVDYDYLEKLSNAERQWLAAFTEEHLRGWSLKRETQVLPLKARRESNAARQRLRRHRDPLAFAVERESVARELAAEPVKDPEAELIRAIDQKRRRKT